MKIKANALVVNKYTAGQTHVLQIVLQPNKIVEHVLPGLLDYPINIVLGGEELNIKLQLHQKLEDKILTQWKIVQEMPLCDLLFDV
jgi:hypothetical protein